MTFLALQARLISVIRVRIRNGEITERAFARMVGISQPHIHNVLKGARALSPELCDRVMDWLGITVLDLVESDAWCAVLIAPLPVRPPRDRSQAPAPRSFAS